MLIVLHGTSCVGKTFIKKFIIEKYNFKPVKCYVTRAIRDDDINRIQVTNDEFHKLKLKGEIKVENKLYNNLYGASEFDLIQSKNENFILDFSIQNYQKIMSYNPKNVLIIVDDIQSRIQLSERTSRKKDILKEYSMYYNDEKLKEYKKLGFNIFLNTLNELEKNSFKLEKTLNLEKCS
jgi:guanylate kinase